MTHGAGQLAFYFLLCLTAK